LQLLQRLLSCSVRCVVEKHFGGAEEDRTPDLCIANAALSQLSYHPTYVRHFTREGVGRKSLLGNAVIAHRTCAAGVDRVRRGVIWGFYEKMLVLSKPPNFMPLNLAMMSDSFIDEASGAPGASPTWCSSAKEMVGCALGPSRLWFTIGGGIVNEVFFPRVDTPQIRDLGFIIADDQGFWIELKRLGNHALRLAAPGVPAVHIKHHHERFDFTLRITPDPWRDVLLLEIQLEGDPGLRPYALLAPHLGGTGHDNDAEVGEYRGRRMLWAEQGPFALALAAVDANQADAWGRASAGFVGASDGWQDFAQHDRMQWQCRHAGPGNVALLGELPRHATLALGFASSKESAATLAVSALLQPFNEPWQEQIHDWELWHAQCSRTIVSDIPASLREQYFTSAMVLRVHQDKIYRGAMVASLSIPWGNTGDERGGYHLVWPRDLVESAGALLALGAEDEARDILRYLIATQHADGHWFQNQWLGGKAYWQGMQLDEVAFPVLLALCLMERGALKGIVINNMVQSALGFIARSGPASPQDRWEEDAGINTFTLAVCIAALVAGAPLLQAEARDFALALADYWNVRLEDWTAVYGSTLARRLNVKGYYVRMGPPQTETNPRAMLDVLPLKNRLHDPGLPAEEQVAVDFLQLVRFGLRRADDPLIVDTLKVVDTLLKTDTASGPAWYRYNGDGYGEHEDGSAFDGVGRGRPWPLLTGERGHCALAAGQDALPYLEAMNAMSGSGGMIPEQIWDSAALPARGLFPGRATGSAMPLVWAHAEFIKLMASRQLGRPFDRPSAIWQRYQGLRPTTQHACWLPQAPIYKISAGENLFIALDTPGIIHWGVDGWQNVQDTLTSDSGLGLYVGLIPTQNLRIGQQLDFTFQNTVSGEWIGRDHHIIVVEAAAQSFPVADTR
jgi:glucoamylase